MKDTPEQIFSAIFVPNKYDSPVNECERLLAINNNIVSSPTRAITTTNSNMLHRVCFSFGGTAHEIRPYDKQVN